MALSVALLFSYPTQRAGFEVTAKNSLSAPQVFSLAVQDKTLQRLKTRHSPYLNHQTQRNLLLQPSLYQWYWKGETTTHIDLSVSQCQENHENRDKKGEP